jgi:hypothetical protein
MSQCVIAKRCRLNLISKIINLYDSGRLYYVNGSLVVCNSLVYVNCTILLVRESILSVPGS